MINHEITQEQYKTYKCRTVKEKIYSNPNSMLLPFTIHDKKLENLVRKSKVRNWQPPNLSTVVVVPKSSWSSSFNFFNKSSFTEVSGIRSSIPGLKRESGIHAIHPMKVLSSTFEGLETSEISLLLKELFFKAQRKEELYIVVSHERSVFCPFGGSEAAGNLVCNGGCNIIMQCNAMPSFHAFHSKDSLYAMKTMKNRLEILNQATTTSAMANAQRK
uniref:Uncharacterized protein n=1 Tax=Megaselia scalaris TaxID=36166 RepID=T1GCW7_MEGSC